MDETDHSKSKIFLTFNDVLCNKKNQILEKYLYRDQNYLNRQWVQKTRQINQVIENIEKSHKKISKSTGRAFENKEDDKTSITSKS